jgi:4-hydroxy-2-oxoheptanedioate aldolase
MARINRAIELLEQDQPVYYTGAEELGYEGGRAMAQTWADFIMYEMEHGPFNIQGLHDFMRGLVDGGPTRSGHRTPPVICTLPTDGTSEAVMRANAWMAKQILATGVHGLLLCHAEGPDAVKTFVEISRYPFQTIGVGHGLAVGRRGSGGQTMASKIWGLSDQEYLVKADPWPLNPQGELLLGLKVENRRALNNVEKSLAIPGIAFSEWGPGDMGMSFGHRDAHDAPYPPEMAAARERVFNACKANKVFFLNTVLPEDVTERIDEGVRFGAGTSGVEAAEIGRRYTRRTLPW